MDLSIIVPLYYKEDSVQPLYEAITKPIAVTTAKYEILLIDDGSKDKTFNILSEYAHWPRGYVRTYEDRLDALLPYN